MIDANNISITSLSKTAINAVSIVLIIAIIVPSYFAVNWLVGTGDSEDITISLITLSQTMVVLFAGWLYVVYLSPKSISSAALRKLVDAFLVQDVCKSLLFADFDGANNNDIAEATNLTIKTTHVSGTAKCSYRLDNKSDGANLLNMYVVMNIRKFEVVYYIPQNIKSAIFDMTKDGAVQSGYDAQISFVENCQDKGFEEYSKMVFRRQLQEGFLTNPEERLFIANDISVMSGSIINELSKGQN